MCRFGLHHKLFGDLNPLGPAAHSAPQTLAEFWALLLRNWVKRRRPKGREGRKGREEKKVRVKKRKWERTGMRVSVRLSHSRATPKRFKMHFAPHNRVMFPFSWLDLTPIFFVPSLRVHANECVKERYPLSKAQIWPLICNNLETLRLRSRM